MEKGVYLQKPFCIDQIICFGGIFGVKTPYMGNFFQLQPLLRPNDNNNDNNMNKNNIIRRSNFKTNFYNTSKELIPVFIIFIIFTFLFFYCIHSERCRHHTNFPINNDNHQILQLQNDTIENEYMYFDNNNNVDGLAQAPVSLNYQNYASPYQFNSNYRPRIETESDYGYSTMTPNDEFELNGSIYINTDIISLNNKTINDDLLSSVSIASNDDTNSNKNQLPPPPSFSKRRSKESYHEHGKLRKEKLKQPNKLPIILDERSIDDAQHLIKIS